MNAATGVSYDAFVSEVVKSVEEGVDPEGAIAGLNKDGMRAVSPTHLPPVCMC